MGYDPFFIEGIEIPLPTLGERTRLVALNDGAPIEHSRFSIIFNRERGFAVVTAHNIDGAALIPEGEIQRRDNFRLDPSVPAELQVADKRGYQNNPWDRGHLVRRRAMHWRDVDEASLADSESFYWTNITPQHTKLHHSAWGKIEDWMLDLADRDDQQVSVFTGPVLTPDDPEHQNKPNEAPIKIPAGFWKILSIKHQGMLRAAGFLVWQRDFDKPIPAKFDPLLEQVRITTIEFLAGLSFGDLRDADPLHFDADRAASRDPEAWRAPKRAGAITSVRDIVL